MYWFRVVLHYNKDLQECLQLQECQLWKVMD